MSVTGVLFVTDVLSKGLSSIIVVILGFISLTSVLTLVSSILVSILVSSIIKVSPPFCSSSIFLTIISSCF